VSNDAHNTPPFAGLATVAIHSDRELNQTRAVVAPIWQSATYERDTSEQLVEAASERAPAEFYARWGNPNNKQLEAVVAALEGAPHALALASGMAAATACITPWLSQGDHVVGAKTLYGDTRHLLQSVLGRFGVSSTFAAGTSVDHYREAIRRNTKLIVLETPANPTMDCVDIAGVCTLAREHGVRVVCDNTFATPYNTQPIKLGAHAVFHSATKYLAGHSDVIAGVIAGDQESVARGWEHLRTEGAVLGPFDAWLVLRGLRTFALRMREHNENALRIAQDLSAHPKVLAVHYPLLPTHAFYSVAQRQMRGGSGVLSVVLHGGSEAAAKFVASLKLFTLAPSLGGVESLVMFPSSLSKMTDAQRRASGIDPGLVRLAVGIEDVRDLLDDLTQALAHV
jgi:methionine-gamma-lyase